MSDPAYDSIPCVRCGRPRRTHRHRISALCRDCIMVARDLGELELWEAA